MPHHFQLSELLSKKSWVSPLHADWTIIAAICSPMRYDELIAFEDKTRLLWRTETKDYASDLLIRKPKLYKRLFVARRPFISFITNPPTLEDVPVKFTAYLCMKAADGSIVNGWLASQTDMLAEDWTILD